MTSGKTEKTTSIFICLNVFLFKKFPPVPMYSQSFHENLIKAETRNSLTKWRESVD